jgi:preprotein translocase subunit SecD
MKDKVAYWVSKKVELDDTNISAVKILIQYQDLHSGNPIEREIYPKVDGVGHTFNNPPNFFEVVISFNEEGQTQLEKLTENNVQRRLAIISDGKLLMVLIIPRKESDGKIRVCGLPFEDAKGIRIAAAHLLYRTTLPSGSSPSVYTGDADLTFRLVHPDHERLSMIPPSEADINERQYDLFVKDKVNYWVSKLVEVDTTDFKGAKILLAEFDQYGKEKISEVSSDELDNEYVFTNPSATGFGARLSLNTNGQKKMENLTENNIKGRLAIVFNGKLLMAPTIQEKISGEEISISGLTSDEARDIKKAIDRLSK